MYSTTLSVSVCLLPYCVSCSTALSRPALYQFLAEHFSHFRSYYHIQCGWGVSGFGAASEEERRFTAAFCFRLMHNLCFEVCGLCARVHVCV